MIAAAKVTIAPEDDLDGHVGNVALRRIAQRSGKLARRRIVFAAGFEPPLPFLGDLLARRDAFGEQPQRAGVALPVLVVRIADDVVGDHRLDPCVALACRVRPVRRAEKSLLLARDGHEDDRRGETALRHRAGELHHDRGTRCVVVRAGRVALGVHHVAAHRVVVAGHDERARFCDRVSAFERGHDVDERRRLLDARRRRLHEFVEPDLEPRAGFGCAAVERCLDPVACGADAALRIVGDRQANAASRTPRAFGHSSRARAGDTSRTRRAMSGSLASGASAATAGTTANVIAHAVNATS